MQYLPTFTAFVVLFLGSSPALTACGGNAGETERAFDYAMALAEERKTAGDDAEVDPDLVEPDPFDTPPPRPNGSAVVILAGGDRAVSIEEADAASPEGPRPTPSSPAPPEAPAAEGERTRSAGAGESAQTEATAAEAVARYERPTDRMIAWALDAHRREVRRCYLRATDGLLPRPRLVVDLGLDVDATGRVATAELDWRDARPLPDLAPCLERVGQDLAFPGPFTGPSRVVLPLVFDAGRPS